MRVDDVFDSDCVIELFTPRLQSFSFLDSHLYKFSATVNLSQVEKVDIVINCLTKDTDLSVRLIKFFLSDGTCKVLHMFSDVLSGWTSPFTRVVLRVKTNLINDGLRLTATVLLIRG
ncbi:uncharacterized protein LOC109809534 isoform X2 [Cajanus cajan]|uniref:uncharacterized protein LOC109809534 isoform X2 n=1 Tax=Cajanus cajan TaxID=3821 RepID=UPI00098DBBA5|nr:uncharacterized protein LOC109809534 isoform X2 [Cajanus cajan]